MTHRSPSTVQRDIAETRNTLAMAPRHNLDAINRNIALLTAKATVDDTYKGDLRMALDNLEVAQQQVAQKHSLTQKLDILEAELVESERLEGVAKREEASRRLSAAMNEFSVHAKNAGIAYRRMVITARQLGYTQRLPAFHSGTLVPASWTGTVSEILNGNPNGLPSLNPEGN